MNKYLKLTWDEIKKSICSEIRYPGKGCQDRDPVKGAAMHTDWRQKRQGCLDQFSIIITKKIITINTNSRVTRLEMKIANKKQYNWHIKRDTGLGGCILVVTGAWKVALEYFNCLLPYPIRFRKITDWTLSLSMLFYKLIPNIKLEDCYNIEEAYTIFESEWW